MQYKLMKARIRQNLSAYVVSDEDIKQKLCYFSHNRRKAASKFLETFELKASPEGGEVVAPWSIEHADLMIGEDD